MQSKAKSPEAYIAEIPTDRVESFTRLRDTILENLPDGFVEGMGYGMIGYVVPKSIYPAGYHCDPKLPLPFVSIASQKNFIALYHMGLYANPELLDWFVEQYPKHSKTKLDMGKSCVRFTKTAQIPYNLIGELMQKISVEDWVRLYDNRYRNKP